MRHIHAQAHLRVAVGCRLVLCCVAACKHVCRSYERVPENICEVLRSLPGIACWQMDLLTGVHVQYFARTQGHCFLFQCWHQVCHRMHQSLYNGLQVL